MFVQTRHTRALNNDITRLGRGKNNKRHDVIIILSPTILLYLYYIKYAPLT